ncbi:MAG TPA: radical SAM family heme chaperone HemW [Ktedonobacterales bacterium]|jgi:oxygen-independent coproporphyrinogen-3 oxidase
MNVTQTSKSRAGKAASALLDSVSLYLHIPFCHVKCHYCDFTSYAGVLRLREPFVAALRDEIAYAGRQARRENGEKRRCRTIFFGGGTPSLLSAEQVALLLAAVRDAFDVNPGAEISLEANPGALEYGHLDELRSLGVNRLSMGAQSFDAALLRWMGRIHSPEDVERAFGAARAAGFDNINLDFMYALPGQTLESWIATLEHALALSPDHLSLYSLIVEEHTPLHRWVSEGKVAPPDDDFAADMYEHARQRLREAGYIHYEISNWARPGRECAHNLAYWRNLPYIGLGAGAHSWYGARRFVEAKSLREYTERVNTALKSPRKDAGATLPAAAIIEEEVISRELEMAETVMLGLRLTAGVELADFERRYGQSLDSVFAERLREARAARLVETVEGRLRLTEQGTLLGNEVFAALLPDAT